MNAPHTPPLPVQVGPRSALVVAGRTQVKAMWSRNPAGQVVLFVHGFRGDAMGTWAGLPGQLCIHGNVSGYDLLFFQYDSLKLNGDESATELHAFLDVLLKTNCPQIVNESLEHYDRTLRRPASWKYKSIVLVGHSLGACVIRKALVDHLNSCRHSWSQSVKMIPVAPVHGGARIIALLTAIAMGAPLKSIKGITDFLAPVLDDLKPGSEFLKKLQSDTLRLGDRYSELIAPLTFWVHRDIVVTNRTYAKDVTPPEVIHGVSHVTICKPTSHSRLVRLLLKEL